MNRTPEISAIGTAVGLAIAVAPSVLGGLLRPSAGGDGQELVIYPVIGLAIAVPSAMVFIGCLVRILLFRPRDQADD
ncbi:MAG: hypothetical protein WA842_03080 [Croceibacterium sp.]